MLCIWSSSLGCSQTPGASALHRRHHLVSKVDQKKKWLCPSYSEWISLDPFSPSFLLVKDCSRTLPRFTLVALLVIQNALNKSGVCELGFRSGMLSSALDLGQHWPTVPPDRRKADVPRCFQSCGMVPSMCPFLWACCCMEMQILSASVALLSDLGDVRAQPCSLSFLGGYRISWSGRTSQHSCWPTSGSIPPGPAGCYIHCIPCLRDTIASGQWGLSP